MATTIFAFLSDQYQHDLKKRADNNTSRFEETMENYKTIFFNDISSLNNISTCTELNPKTNHLSITNKKNLLDWLDCFQQTIVSSSTALKSFFDELIDIYKTYVSGNTTEASIKFNALLTNHNLYDSAENFEKQYPITFRGRTNNSKKSIFNIFRSKKPPIKSDYFYHIPFDKIHFVKNYRFSITGHPFIYLGSSIPTVLLELRSNLTKFNNIELSAWGINPHESLKMYDISNSLYDLINLNIIPIFNDTAGLTCQDTHVVPNINTFVTDFKKFIISQFCTFKKNDKNGDVFVQQYVLPQLLTEQIRNYQKIKYDGFIFPSTQYLDRVTTVDSEIYYGLFKNNIALFTNYSSTDNYDNNLISKFTIIPIDKSTSLTANDYQSKCDVITFTQSDISKGVIKIRLKLLKEYYSKMKLDKINLTELKSIRVQFAVMLEYIKKL